VFETNEVDDGGLEVGIVSIEFGGCPLADRLGGKIWNAARLIKIGRLYSQIIGRRIRSLYDFLTPA
jgi:hypothetical protein